MHPIHFDGAQEMHKPGDMTDEQCYSLWAMPNESNTSIVIPLGIGSHWDNTEIRYCLRSIEKHLTGYGDVFIIGELPYWMRNVIHIPFKEQSTQSYDKERNIYNKIMAACADERVTGDFLFMNDDHFLLQDFEAGKFPYYCQGWLSEFLTVTDYKHTVKNTIDWLLGRDCPYFDVHCPIVYNKEKFQWCVLCADWTVKWGYCIKTIFCEINAITAPEYLDLKINEVYSSDRIRKLIAGRPWFSIGDRAREGGLLKVLQELYPNKSKYE